MLRILRILGILRICSAWSCLCCIWEELSASSCSALSWWSTGGSGYTSRSCTSWFSSCSSETFCDRTVVGYKHTWMLKKRYRMNVSYKIFCGWDFTIQDPDSASLKQSCIRNNLKVNFKWRIAVLNLSQTDQIRETRWNFQPFLKKQSTGKICRYHMCPLTCDLEALVDNFNC